MDYREDQYEERMRAMLGTQEKAKSWCWSCIIIPVLAAIGFGVILGVLWGCAAPSVPWCTPYQFSLAESEEGEQVIVLDLPNVIALSKMIKGLDAGTCRLRKGDEV